MTNHNLQLVYLINGPEDGAIVAVRLSHFPDGSLFTTRTSAAHPDHLVLYRGELPFYERTPRLYFDSWQSKDLSGAKPLHVQEDEMDFLENQNRAKS